MGNNDKPGWVRAHSWEPTWARNNRAGLLPWMLSCKQRPHEALFLHTALHDILMHGPIKTLIILHITSGTGYSGVTVRWDTDNVTFDMRSRCVDPLWGSADVCWPLLHFKFNLFAFINCDTYNKVHGSWGSMKISCSFSRSLFLINIE